MKTDPQLRQRHPHARRRHARERPRNGIVKAVRNYLEVHDIKHKGVTLTGEDIREGAIGVLSVFHSDPMFQGQTKERLNNPELTGVVEGIVRPGIETWLNGNPSIADAIIGRIVLAAQGGWPAATRPARSAAKRPGPIARTCPASCSTAGKEIRRKVSSSSSRETRPAARPQWARQPYPSRPAAAGQNPQYRVARPLEDLENQEVKDLIEALGTGIGPSFDFRKLH